MENLTGGTNADTFIFTNAGTILGAINGGDGNDTITGDNAARTYTINGANAGNISTILPLTNGFMNVESLVGGSAGDSFMFATGGSLTGSINDTGGNDTITGDNVARTYTISGTNTGKISTILPLTNGFMNVESLVGGSADDSFLFATGGSLTGSINGGGGTNDAITGDNAARTYTINDANAGNISTILPLTNGFMSVEFVIGGDGADTITFGASGSLSGRADGGAGNDTLTGNALANTLAGGAGNDAFNIAINATAILQGGGGNDSFNFTGNGVVLTGSVDGQAGSDTLGYSGYSSSVSLTLTSSGGNGFTGNGTGLAGAGTFNGIESITGGQGSDSLTGQTADNNWAVTNTLSVTVPSTNQTLNFSSFESLIGGSLVDTFSVTGVRTVSLKGGGGNDTIIFTDSSAKITGSVDGEAGDDKLDYSSYLSGQGVAVDLRTVTAPGAPGIDGTIANLENVTGGASNDSLTGNAAANTLLGNGGDDTLVGIGGNDATGRRDSLDGGASNFDTVVYSVAGGPVTVNLGAAAQPRATADGDTGQDDLTSIEIVVGSNFNDNLTGTTASETLEGGGGNDNLIGGGGNDTYRFDLDNGLGTDTVNAGAGIDLLDFSSSAAAVTVNLSAAGTPQKVVDQSGVLVLFLSPANTIENVTGGAGADSITGSGSANTLTGGAGNDMLTGGAGNDYLKGETGSDTYFFGDFATGEIDTVDESGTAATGGEDTLDFSKSMQSLIVNLMNSNVAGSPLAKIKNTPVLNGTNPRTFETVIGGSGNDTITGIIDQEIPTLIKLGAGKNSVTGGRGNDTLIGASGVDSMLGGEGNDVMQGDGTPGKPASNDKLLDGQSGNDTLDGGNGNEKRIIGGPGGDSLLGGDGNDKLYGDGTNSKSLLPGSGLDTLTGGPGADSFDCGFGDNLIDELNTDLSDKPPKNCP